MESIGQSILLTILLLLAIAFMIDWIAYGDKPSKSCHMKYQVFPYVYDLDDRSSRQQRICYIILLAVIAFVLGLNNINIFFSMFVTFIFGAGCFFFIQKKRVLPAIITALGRAPLGFLWFSLFHLLGNNLNK